MCRVEDQLDRVFACLCVCSVYDGSVHVFYGRQLWRLTDRGLDSPDYPVNTRTVYDHAPSTVDAAVYSTLTHHDVLVQR